MLHGTEGEYWADHKARNCRFVTERAGYEDYNPNFFRSFDSWDPGVATDVWGYGYESIVQGIRDIARLQSETEGLAAGPALEARKSILGQLAPKRALPEQALIGTAVNEAVRLSIANGNAFIGFDGDMTPVLAGS
jgi:hypothetical protein